MARIQLKYLEKRLARLERGLEITDAALEELAKGGFDLVFGARPLKCVMKRIENPMAKAILEGKFDANDVPSESFLLRRLMIPIYGWCIPNGVRVCGIWAVVLLNESLRVSRRRLCLSQAVTACSLRLR